jgi:hypothetical protein
MTEAAYVELPILSWLCGKLNSGASGGGLGWTFRDETAMAMFDRPLEDPLVEKLLVTAILRINADVKTATQAKLAIAALRKTMSHPDKLAANRQTLDLLRDGAKVVLNPGEDAKTVQFIAFDLARQQLNDFAATNQYRVQGVRQCREDSCSARQNLSFNWQLILAPDFVLRYLVTHEAVHLDVPDHSARFWLTVQSLCPHTERAKQWLSANGTKLILEFDRAVRDQLSRP